jgi:hypothetical protein
VQQVKKAEEVLADVFKGLPNLSDSTREALAKFWPWLALIGGVAQLIAAWALWGVIHLTVVISDYSAGYYQSVTGRHIGISSFDKTMLYLGILVLVVDAVILLMAYPKLKVRARAGWDLLFLGALVNVVYSVLSLLLHDRGFVNFLSGLAGSFVGFYLLFQVRGKFGAGHAPVVAKSAAAPHTPDKTHIK